TPENYKQFVTFGGTGGGLSSYTGYPSTNSGIVPTIAQVSVSPSSLDFGSQDVGTTSGTMTAVLSNNTSTAFTISSISIVGANAGDFSQTNNCPVGAPNGFASGGSCTITVTFT